MRYAIVAALALAVAGCADEAPPPPPPPRPLTTPPPEPEPPPPPPTAEEVPGFPGFYVPAGGQGGPPPHGGTSMVVYQYGMPQADLAAAVRPLLSRHGWNVESETTSPRGSIRMVVANGQNTIDLRIAGEGDSAALILTRR